MVHFFILLKEENLLSVERGRDGRKHLVHLEDAFWTAKKLMFTWLREVIMMFVYVCGHSNIKKIAES